MNNLVYMKEGHLDDLRKHISHNHHFYVEDEPWLDKFFREGAWGLSSKIEFPYVELVDFSEDTEKSENDLINSKLLYGSLKNLSLTQASDERLWVALSHTVFWKYMRKRWPADDYSPDNIKERYFFISNRSRALVRNGISRLWWYGYTSYDETRSDPFELTAILCKTTDIAASLTERAFSHNKNLSLAILSILMDREKAGEPFLKRDVFRELMKFINQTGGMSILDSLDRLDLEEIMAQKIHSLMEKVAGDN